MLENKMFSKKNYLNIWHDILYLTLRIYWLIKRFQSFVCTWPWSTHSYDCFLLHQHLLDIQEIEQTSEQEANCSTKVPTFSVRCFDDILVKLTALICGWVYDGFWISLLGLMYFQLNLWTTATLGTSNLWPLLIGGRCSVVGLC